MWGKTVWNAIIPAIGPEQLKDTQARLQIYKEAEINSKIKTCTDIRKRNISKHLPVQSANLIIFLTNILKGKQNI